MNVGAPKERPILFSGPMVKAILSGAKTQTRRLIKASGPWDVYEGRDMDPWPLRGPGQGARVPCPYGFPGDRLWVRETWALLTGAGVRVVYRADGEPRQRFYPDEAIPMKWAPSIHMPRKYSRLALDVTGVRVERIRDISHADVRAEGFERRDDLMQLWVKLNGVGTWADNPWVWVVEFKRAEAAR